MKKLLIVIALIFSLMPAAVVHAGYYGSWKIDDYLSFTANTHTASTGAATDADAVPSYRIYEDETGTAILTGSMALLDDANTTGLYSEQVQLTAANGLEKGKSYTIFISATVSSVAGTISHNFQIEAEVDANVVSDKTGYTASTVSDKTGYSLAADQSAVTVGTVNALGAQAKLDVNAEADTALADYDAPTRAEATTDKDAIITEVNANETKIDTAQADLDLLTGADGATLATSQPNYAPNTVVPDAAGTLATYDPPTNAEMVAAFTEIKGATWDVTDTLEALRDRGDAAWITAAGFSTHAAADIWAVGTRALTDKAGFSLAADQSAVTIGTVTTNTDMRGTDGANTTVPDPAGTLATYDPPTNAEMVAAFTEIKGATWDVTDTLEAIRDRGDAAWITAAGFSTHNAADIWSVGTRALTDKAGFTISGAKNTLDALNDISVAGIISGVADGPNDLQEMMRIIFSVCAGKSNGGGTATINFRDSADGKNRVTATVDVNGNRTAVTLDGS